MKANKDTSFHIRPFLSNLYEIWQWIRMINRNVPLRSPHLIDCPKSPTWLGLINKPYENVVTLTGQNPHAASLLSLIFECWKLGICKSKCCKVTNLQTLRMIEFAWDQIQANLFQWGLSQTANLLLRLLTLSASNFEALFYTNPILTVWKDLNRLKKYIKNQRASYNFRFAFAPSNRPHFHRVY